MNKLLLLYQTAILLMLIITMCGCKTIVIDRTPDPQKYIAMWSWSAGEAKVISYKSPVNPNPRPKPTPNPGKVVPTKDCKTCIGLDGKPVGYLGDTTIKRDCPDCDYNGDGSNDDPDNLYRSISLEDIKISMEKQVARYDNWVFDPTTARAKAEAENKGILVYIGLEKPEWSSDFLKTVTSKYVLFFDDANNKEKANEWAKLKPNHPLVAQEGANYYFKSPVVCILTTAGKFADNYLYTDAQQNEEKLLPILMKKES